MDFPEATKYEESFKNQSITIYYNTILMGSENEVRGKRRRKMPKKLNNFSVEVGQSYLDFHPLVSTQLVTNLKVHLW